MGEVQEKKIKVKRTVQQVTGTSAPISGLRHFGVSVGVPDVNTLRIEIDEMMDVLMGREEPPVPPENVGSMLEVANAYYSRGMEISGLIKRMEASGIILKGSEMYKFRTGELRTFCEIAKGAVDLGSRRVTLAQMEADQRYG